MCVSCVKGLQRAVVHKTNIPTKQIKYGLLYYVDLILSKVKLVILCLVQQQQPGSY